MVLINPATMVASCVDDLLEKYPDDINIVKPSFAEEKDCLEIYRRYEETGG